MIPHSHQSVEPSLRHPLSLLRGALAFSTFYTLLFYSNKHPVSQFYRVPLYADCDPDEAAEERLLEDFEDFFFPLLILNRRFVQFTNYLRK
jgi:hypothetical protein